MGVVVVFQVAVALDAPLGRWTQGGGVDGPLQMSGRLVAWFRPRCSSSWRSACWRGTSGRSARRLAAS